MSDLTDALRNPLLVTDERFGLTRKAADRIERLEALLADALDDEVALRMMWGWCEEVRAELARKDG